MVRFLLEQNYRFPLVGILCVVVHTGVDFLF